MSIRCSNTAYLEASSDAGANTYSFMRHAWAYTSEINFFSIVGSGTGGTTDHSTYIDFTSADFRFRQNRRSTTTSSTAGGTDSISISTWYSVAGSLVSTTLAECFVSGVKKAETTTSHVLNSMPTTRIGTLMDATAGNLRGHLAEISHWNVTGFTEAQRTALANRLYTLVGGKVPNPRNVNNDTGEAWTNKLVWYVPLTNTGDTSDVHTSGLAFSAVGSPTWEAAIHPDVEAYVAPSTLYPSMEPLYYGANLLASKTGIEYFVTSGHTGLDGDVITSGVNGTTDGSGNFVWPGSGFAGVATDPVTVHLYWEEGNPAVDRSLIVKTTLVEA